MKYHIAICDDEQNQIEYLSGLVRNWAKHNGMMVSIHPFSSAEEFLFKYEDEKDYDVLLLDIELKHMNGVELAKQLRAANDGIQIVFITGYPDFIAEGYEVAALHYLMKPVREEKLKEVLDRAIVNLSKKNRVIFIRSGKDNRRILVDSIVYVEVLSHTVTICTTDTEYKTKLSITEIEEMLGKGFIRCHRSYIANLQYMACITKTHVVFDDNRTIPLARSAYRAVNQAFIDCYKGGLP